AIRPFDRATLGARLVRMVDQRADQVAHLARGREDRVAVVEAGVAHLRLAGTDELAGERLEQPGEIAMRVPAAHASLQPRPRRMSARRMRLRVVSYSRAVMA